MLRIIKRKILVNLKEAKKCGKLKIGEFKSDFNLL